MTVASLIVRSIATTLSSLDFDNLALAPFCICFRVDPELLAQRREQSLRSLYCCSNGGRARGAAMTWLLP
ncbi:MULTISPECIES: hypothetical protein [Gluconobacter]|uniref:hypothetical protein n=1 Tax=Gluconobacter japonicus TaxID=376620 RepID=UPI0013DDE35B